MKEDVHHAICLIQPTGKEEMARHGTVIAHGCKNRLDAFTSYRLILSTCSLNIDVEFRLDSRSMQWTRQIVTYNLERKHVKRNGQSLQPQG